MRAWHHLVVEGPAATARSFVAGVLADGGIGVTPRWGGALGLEHHSLAERVKELLVGDHHEELFVPADIADVIANALAAGGASVSLRLTQRQVIHGAQFAWTAHTPSREAQRHIRAQLVESLPSGVQIADLKENEELDPTAAGTNLYTAAHSFEYHASGRATGTAPGILDLYVTSTNLEFVQVSPLTVDLIAL